MKISVTGQKRTQHRQAPQRDSTLYSATLPLPIRSRLSTTATIAALRAAGQESAYQVWRSRVGVKLCVHAMLNYRLLPLEDGGNLHLIEDHGVYQFA